MARILILGGTTEARQLAQKLAARGDCELTVSLAGRTANPAPYPAPIRTGGFGGSKGLAEYLLANDIAVLVDATHPYAATISANAACAAARAGVKLVALGRPPWQAVAGDRWSLVRDVVEARAALGWAPRRVFLALGRQEIRGFEQSPQHAYLVRSIEPITPPLAVRHACYVLGRGPFSAAEDRALLQAHGIEVIVTKNSGGDASYGKIAAARELGLAVIMLERPPAPPQPAFARVEDVIDFLDHSLAMRAARGV